MTTEDNFPELLERLITERFGAKGKGAFAAAMGVHSPVVSHWLKDRQPKLDTLIKMAEVLEVPLSMLQAPFIECVHSPESEHSLNADEPSIARETGSTYGSESLTNQRMVKLLPSSSKRQLRSEQAAHEIQVRLLALASATPAERKALKDEISHRVNEFERFVDLEPDRPHN